VRLSAESRRLLEEDLGEVYLGGSKGESETAAD